MTKIKFAKEWLDNIKAEIFKRELIVEMQEESDGRDVDIDALKTNIEKDGEMVSFLEKWIKKHTKK
jgi:hypothetical protein